MNKPNLFLIGAPKCGTTALAINLSQHPNIYLPKQKEPRYFDRKIFYDFSDDYITTTLDKYLKHYDNPQAGNTKYKMDASVFNMYKANNIQEIVDFSPNAKFIVILRDPVEASLSMFHQRLSYVETHMREVCEEFNRCWNMLEMRKNHQGYPKGCRNKFLFRYDLLYSYENYLPQLIDTLGDRLFIGFYEDYKNEPKKFFEQIFDFLDIPYIEIENKKHNSSKIVSQNIFLKSLKLIANKTFTIRQYLGLTGKINLEKNIVSKFKKETKKDIVIDKKVYDFFEPTYKYLEKLKDEVKYKNPKQ